MNALNKVLVSYLSEHWQFICGGLLYFIGADLLCAAKDNYWVVQSGIFSQHISVVLFAFKPVAAFLANYSPGTSNVMRTEITDVK